MEFRAVDPFIKELIRAANEIDKITKSEQARLLRRAATTIRDYRGEIGFSQAPANDTGDIVYDLNDMANMVYLFGAQEVVAAMLNAVETIKDCRMILEAKREAVGHPTQS